MGLLVGILILIAGFVLCVKGSDLLVDVAKWLARTTGISITVIGATLIAFSTSAPELFVTLFATLRGYDDMAVAGIVGSEAVNVGIGIGVIALVRPGAHGDRLFSVRGIIMIIALVMLLGFAATGVISWVHGIFFALVFVLFTYFNIRYCRNKVASGQGLTGDCCCETMVVEREPTSRKEIAKNILLFVIGLACVLFGAHLIVDRATFLAQRFGMSEALIGITIIAIGTSAPEIITCIVAVAKNEKGLAVGNIIGSSVFNVAFVFAIVSFAAGSITVDTSMAHVEIPIIVAMSIVAIVPSLFTKKMHRIQGILLFALYALFLTLAIVL